MDLDEVILVIDAQMPIRARRIKSFEDPALKVLHAGQAGSFPYPDEDGLRRDRQISETRETVEVVSNPAVEKLKLELQDMRAAAGAQQGSTGALTAAEEPTKEPQTLKPGLPGRMRGRAARDAVGGAAGGSLSVDLAGLGIKAADATGLATAVQTTRAIIAQYA